jgi:hypothetical protein
MSYDEILNMYSSQNGSEIRELVVFDNLKHSLARTSDEIWIATGHDLIQCDQLAILIKIKGYAVIKIGDIHELIPMAETLELAGFKTMICKENGTPHQ